MSKNPGQDSFLVKILNKQHASWQGTITRTESNRTEPFRSALELIKLIDSALDERPAPDQTSS